MIILSHRFLLNNQSKLLKPQNIPWVEFVLLRDYFGRLLKPMAQNHQYLFISIFVQKYLVCAANVEKEKDAFVFIPLMKFIAMLRKKKNISKGETKKTGGNFINMLHTNFSYEHHFGSFF